MRSCDMTEEIIHAGFATHQTFLNSSCGTSNGVLDFGKLDPCIDGIRPFLGPSLDNRIRSILEEFVCKPNSNYAKRFPRVKRIVDTVAGWSDRLDVSVHANVKQEMIKHAMKYLVKDGLVTQIGDPVALNSGPNKVDPDPLADEQDALKNMNVWRFINEKDYWLCQDCATPTCIEPSTGLQIHECTRDTSSSDLDVEVGSVSQDPPIPHNTCRTTCACDSGLSRRDEDTKPGLNTNRRNFEFVIESHRNVSNSNKDSFDKSNCCHENAEKIDTRMKFSCDTKSVQTQACSKQLSFVFKQVQTNPNRPDKPKPKPRSKRLETLSEEADCTCVQDAPCRRSKLKICINKSTSTSRSRLRQPSNVSNLSLPCKPSQLIVRLFEADPSLSDSCLILMRKKFEKDMSNACSCMNDILKKLDDSMIKQLRLNCDIRPGRVDLNLQCSGTSKVRWFLARVPTCSNVHKRDPCHGSLEDRMDRCKVARHSDLPVDPGCLGDRSRVVEGFEPPTAFYSICSSHSFAQTKHTCTSGSEIEKEEKRKEVNFIWTRKEKHVDFLFSPPLGNSERNKEPSVEADVGLTEERDTMLDEVCDREGVVMEDCRQQQVDVCSERLVAVDSENKLIDSCDLCSCSTDSLREVGIVEGSSTNGGCNPDQCFCHVFRTDDDLGNERESVYSTYPVAENSNEDPGPRRVENAAQGLVLQTECELQLDRIEADASTRETRASESKDGTRKMEDPCVTEKYSEDSICPVNSGSQEASYDGRCSCCGQDLSNASPEINPACNNETQETSRVRQKAVAWGDVKDSSSPPYPEFKVALHFAGQSNTPSTSDRLCDGVDRSPRAFDHACDENGKIPSPTPITESLFYKGSMRQTSSTNSSTDEEACWNKNNRTTSPQTNTKFNSPCRRRIPPPCPRKSRYPRTRVTSCLAKDLPRVNGARRNSKRKEEDVPAVSRYKNRSWRESVVPSNLCGSFPAIDRIKYLIRKKLRKLLLEERDKGTSTSKTFLRNDRYLVSISSGKLNEGRLLREACSVRCPFTSRNRCEASKVPEKTFTEGSFLGRNKSVLGNIVRAGCQRMIQGNDVLRKMTEFSGPRKHESKSTDTQDLIGDRGAPWGKCKLKVRHGVSRVRESPGNRSSVVSFSSSKMVSFVDYDEKLLRSIDEEDNDCKVCIEDFSVDSRSARPGRSMGKRYKRDSSGSLFEREEKERRADGEHRIYSDKLRSFEERLSKLERRRVVDNNFASILGDYEKRVNELDADFRLKLLQYVTLCRDVKNSLMKRIQPGDVYEVSSSSV